MRALDFFSECLRQHVLVEREIGHQPLQSAVFFLQLPEPPQLAHAQVGVFLLPGVEGGITDPELSAEVADGGPAFGLTDGLDDLLLRESRPLHGSAPFIEDHRSR